MAETDLKANARALMRKNAPGLFFIAAVYALFSVMLLMIIIRLPGSVDFGYLNERLASGETFNIKILFRDFRPVGVFQAVLVYMFFPVIDFGLICYSLKLIRGQKSGFKDLLYGFHLFAKVIAIFLITTALIFIWSLLLIIPGIIAAYKYRLAYYILLDDPSKGAFQCIDESSVLISGSKVDLCILDISFLVWYAADFLAAWPVPYFTPLPFMFHSIIYICLAPYKNITIAGFYEERRNSVAV